ncbi:MAG: glycogen/starch synthase [Prolixibacteraceae bacterium]|nr:glycogen/starch synthase [Prolixibacteraceae bacterium]
MEKKKILFISQEIVPFLPKSEMSVRARKLPQGIQEKGREIRTFMPRYGLVNERRNQLHEVIRLSGMNLIINDTDHQLIIKVASIQAARMQVYFIDNEDYFQRKGILKDNKGKDFADNDERAVFFARGVLETVEKLRWAPDIIHCCGWLSSLVPLFVKKAYAVDPLFAKTKVVYSLFNEEFKSKLNPKIADNIVTEGVSKEDISELKDFSYESLNNIGIQYADAVIQESENVAPELLDFIKAKEKYFLPYQSDDSYLESYNDLYEKLL